MKKSNKKVLTKDLFMIITIVLILLSITIVVFYLVFDTPEEVLTKFYKAIYIFSDLDNMKSCLVESYRFYFEQAVTMAGMDPRFYESYHDDAVKLLGEDIKVKIKVIDKTHVDDRKLFLLMQKDRTVSTAYSVAYDIIFTGNGKDLTYSNTIDMVKIGTRWYMTTHLELPIGRNTYAY